MDINYVDVCCGLAWGDEAKGKIVSQLASSKKYEFVCRWAGGNNAGHTIYIDSKKFKTHLIPSGIFYGIKSIIGPDCVVNKDFFQEEINYLKEKGFDTSLVKISKRCHIVTDSHIDEDKKTYYKTQGSTAKGIAPCYKDKYGRSGFRIEDDPFFESYIWDDNLYGNVLCEGAQGFWLDINYGNYPYVTSSTTLPYGACSLGFPPQKIRNIYGACKIYDTRSGIDPDFPIELLDDPELSKLAKYGEEYGTTTGRKRIVNWLNLDKLLKAIKISGTNILVISKLDVFEKLDNLKIYSEDSLIEFMNLDDLIYFVNDKIRSEKNYITTIHYSDNPEYVNSLI